MDFSIIDVIKDNFKITKENVKVDDISLIYLGFYQHFINYIDAYQLLYNAHNFYVCHGIERSLIELYLKIRLFVEVSDLNDLCQFYWEDKSLNKYKNFIQIQKSLTYTNLCRYFDSQDNSYTFFPGTDIKVSDKGFLEEKYAKNSSYIHPDKESALEYYRKEKWSTEEKEMELENQKNDALGMLTLCSRINDVLSQLYKRLKNN